jgi:ribose transport system ATP-binding protein
VEILKAVSKNAKFIIMDEPTAPLTLKETEIFFRIIRKLKEKKVTIIFISHRLTEVFDLCERVTVFCDGRFVTTKETGEVTKKQLISYMVGRELADDYPAGNGKTGNVVLEARHITGKRVHDVSFELREGEVLGIGGLVGAGRTELARAVYGADPVLSGEFLLDGKRFVPKSPRTALEHGIGLIPEDRKKQGLILDATVKENSALSILRRCSDFGVINKKEEERTVHRYIKDLNIKTPGMNQLVKNLSGGNQQKVVLAKMLATNCKILIFDEPTRGIDVGAKQEIYHLIREMTDQGKAVIMISSEMPELIGMSDRILVMADGRLKGEIGRGDFTQEHILEMASDLD